MNNQNPLIQLIEDSLDDGFLSKNEKRQIKEILKSESPDKRLSDLLRSQFFGIAREKVNAENFHDILNWIEAMNKLLLSVGNTKSNNDRVYFSPGEDCLNAILLQIKKAKKVIRICLFTISDNRIAEELIKKHKSGVRIKIITDNDKVFDKGSDIRFLSDSGISVKVDMTDNHMHHKFALFDRKTTLTGSYNWTRSAEKYNNENILLSDSQKIQSDFENEFERLWDKLVYFDKL